MKNPSKSYYEEKASEFLKRNIEVNMFVSFPIFQESQSLIEKILGTCEDLRKSRDKWKKKYTEFKNGNHQINE